MRTIRRALSTLVTVAMVGGLAVGCGRAEQEALKEVRAALRKTSQLSYRYVYDVELPSFGVNYGIRGIVEDDLRYKSQLTFQGKPGIEEVVSDDAVAMRFFEPIALKLYENPEGGKGDTGKRQGEAEEKLAPDVEVKGALAAGQWVMDPSGAPSVLAGAIDLRTINTDPLYDSLRFLQYVEQMLRSNGVYEFNEDALDYRPQEDPFRDLLPKKLFPGRSVKRYDFGRPPLPKASDTQAGNQITPGMEHFRYMAIFVEDGVIIRIDETINLELQLDDLRKNYELDLPDDPEEAVNVSVKAINAVRTAQGEPPIILRTVSLQLASIGEENKVELPQGEDIVVGSLSVLKGRGRSAEGSGLVTVPGSEAASSSSEDETPAATEPAEPAAGGDG
jgi:hypothetical protein